MRIFGLVRSIAAMGMYFLAAGAVSCGESEFDGDVGASKYFNKKEKKR